MRQSHTPTADTSSSSAEPGSEDRYRAPALDKGLDILELLAQQPQGLTRAEIVKAMERSASEIYRMLERLVARQYVMRSAGGDRYSLSLKLFALAHRHPPLNRLLNLALPIMDEFARSAEQSCHLGVYDRGNVLVTAQIDSPRGWSFSLHRGARVGLLDTASGHVLLAFSDEASAQRMYTEHQSVEGEVPISDADLQATLQTIRTQGYLERDSQHAYGVVDISFPILGPNQQAIAALTCPYIHRIDRHAGPDLAQVRGLLGKATDALSLGQEC